MLTDRQSRSLLDEIERAERHAARLLRERRGFPVWLEADFTKECLERALNQLTADSIAEVKRDIEAALRKPHRDDPLLVEMVRPLGRKATQRLQTLGRRMRDRVLRAVIAKLDDLEVAA